MESQRGSQRLVRKNAVVAVRTEATLSHGGPVCSCAVSPDGKKLLSAGRGTHKLRLWDIGQRPRLQREFDGHTGLINCCAFFADGVRAVSVSRDNTVRIWNLQSGANKSLSLPVSHCRIINPDMLAVSCSTDFSVQLLDADTLRSVRSLHGHKDVVCCSDVSCDGKQLVTSSCDRTAIVWSLVSGRPLQTLTAHSDVVFSCAFSPISSDIILTSSSDKTLRLWKDGKTMMVLTGHTSDVSRCCFSPNGKQIISVSWDATGCIWDVASGVPLARLVGHDDWVTNCDISSDGKRIVTCSDDETVKIWINPTV